MNINSGTSQFTRRNRDHPARRSHELGGSTSFPTAAPSSQLQSSMLDTQTPVAEPQHAPGSLEQVLAKGHAWLRFPAALEAEFKQDTAAARRRLLTICAAIGIVGYWLGSGADAILMPDIPAQANQARTAVLVCMLLSFAVLLGLPRAVSRQWHFEFVTAATTLSLSLATVWTATQSHVDSAITDSVCWFAGTMYGGLAARQRFRWTALSNLVSLAAYMLFVHGHTPRQELIVASNIRFLGLAVGFTLVANYVFEYSERRVWLLNKLDAKRRTELLENNERLRQQSVLDPLTGLFNRTQFGADMKSAWQEASAHAEPVSMLLLDVDFFKRYNDNYGHPAGDVCLKRVAEVLATQARLHQACAARLGGEEFGLLLPGRSLEDAELIGQQICQAMRDAGIEHRSSNAAKCVTLSVGAARVWPSQGARKSTLTACADRALYLAKESGRNRVCVFDPASPEDLPATPLQGSADVLQTRQAALKAKAPVPDETEKAVESVLEQGFRWLRFPAKLEALYQERNAVRRKRFLPVAGALGLAVYNVYTIAGLDMFPDIVNLMLRTQVTLTLGLAGLIAASLLIRMQARIRELLFAGGAAFASVVSAYVLGQSHELTAYSYAICLLLTPMFSAIAVRSPFWLACGATLSMMLSLIFFIQAPTPEGSVVLDDTKFMVGNACVYLLIASYLLEWGERKRWLLGQLEQRRREALGIVAKRLHQLSMQDPLTGLSNRRQFEADFSRVWGDASQSSENVAMIILDVDYFKLYNDNYGHLAGDACLKQVAAALSAEAKLARGLVSRLGGEEFGVLLPGMDADQAELVGERICAAVRQAQIEHKHSRVAGHITVSAGVASAVASAAINPRQLLALADDALYEAKTSGRNRVMVSKSGWPS